MIRRSTRLLLRRALVDADVDEAVDQYVVESPAAAIGFIDALESTYRVIRRTPALGAPRYAHELRMPGLRFWRCGSFPYLIFYIEHADRIDLLRVLHERRDLPCRLLADDDP